MKEAVQQAIDAWLRSLEAYSLPELQYKPIPGQWSAGQLYLHLLGDTNFYLDQAEACWNGEENAEKSCNAFAQKILSDNAFPDMKIEGHPDNAHIPQPLSKEQLATGLASLKHRVELLAEKYRLEKTSGKSLHPGFGYLNVPEWLQLAGMHFRHHLRQKQRLDALLQK